MSGKLVVVGTPIGNLSDFSPRAAEALAFGPEPVVPFYVRPSDAEENLPALSASLGLDPAEAEAALRAFGVEAPDGEPS